MNNEFSLEFKTWTSLIALLIVLIIVVAMMRVENQKQLLRQYEAYKRVYKIDMKYEDYKTLYNSNQLPKFIEGK